MTQPFTSGHFEESAVLIRQEPGHYNDYGEWVEGSEMRAEITLVSAPPSDGTMRDVLPEGARLEDWRQFWLADTVQPLRVGEGPTEGDVIEYGGIRYRAWRVKDWAPHGFVEVLAVREEGQSD